MHLRETHFFAPIILNICKLHKIRKKLSSLYHSTQKYIRMIAIIKTLFLRYFWLSAVLSSKAHKGLVYLFTLH